MIEVTFYKNGYEINGHADAETCYQVSILAWSFANLIQEHEKGDYYTSDYDNSNAGYTHFTYTPTNGKGDWLLKRFKAHLKSWAAHYRWVDDGHICFIEKYEELTIADNFKQIKGIA
jgi:uncharacterized protein YsxB (DUF464 family)